MVPDNYAINRRRIYLLNRNDADLSFLFTILAGEKANAHLRSEYLTVLEADNSAPCFLNLHNEEIAHTLILGMTRAGKLNLRRRPFQGRRRWQGLLIALLIFDSNFGSLLRVCRRFLLSGQEDRMTKEELKAGVECAFETSQSPDSPLQHIRLIERVRGRWKAEWIDPNPGRIGYAISKQIVTRWEEHEDFQRDKVSMAHLTEYNKSLGYLPESPTDRAIQEIFENTGDSISYHNGVVSSSPEVLNRFMVRIGSNKYELKSPAYMDRKGDLNLPFDQGMELAQSFCKVEPFSVLTDVTATERRWSSEASRPGGEYLIPLLNSYRAAWAILRQWCHNDAFTAAREKEISTLVQLVWDAVYALQKAGAHEEAARLRHVLEHG